MGRTKSSSQHGDSRKKDTIATTRRTARTNIKKSSAVTNPIVVAKQISKRKTNNRKPIEVAFDDSTNDEDIDQDILNLPADNQLRNNTTIYQQLKENMDLLQAQLESVRTLNSQQIRVDTRELSSVPANTTQHMNYRMKCPKFNGNEDDDFDVWFDDIQAFFKLGRYSETEKVTMIHAHLGGEARKYMHGLDEALYDTVEKFYKLLKDAFSERIDWNTALTNSKQKPDEKVKTFALRLKVCARKCKLNFDQADKLCLSLFKQNSTPQICRLLRLCMPGITFDQAVDHAMQYEQQYESRKRKWEQVDHLEELSSDEEAESNGRKKISKISRTNC